MLSFGPSYSLYSHYGTGYIFLNPYGIIVVTERINVQIIASPTHFALISEVLFSGILAELFGLYKLKPS